MAIVVNFCNCDNAVIDEERIKKEDCLLFIYLDEGVVFNLDKAFYNYFILYVAYVVVDEQKGLVYVLYIGAVIYYGSGCMNIGNRKVQISHGNNIKEASIKNEIASEI